MILSQSHSGHVPNETATLLSVVQTPPPHTSPASEHDGLVRFDEARHRAFAPPNKELPIFQYGLS